MIIALILYVVVAFVVGCIVYTVSNPYGHITKKEQWKQTIRYSTLWFFYLCYLIGVIFYYKVWKGE